MRCLAKFLACYVACPIGTLSVAVVSLAVLFVWPWYFGAQNYSAYIAFAGTILALIGGVNIARPVLRLGYAEWLKGLQTIDCGSIIEKIGIEDEEKRDAAAVQKMGPILIFLGTLINGVSGFFT